MKIVVQFEKNNKKEKLILIPEKNLVTGIKDFRKRYGEPSSIEHDMLNLASTVYASDLANKRGERENFSRNFEINLPVINYQLFNNLRENLENLLYNLTDDNWNFTFTKQTKKNDLDIKFKAKDGVTLLFSGGLDSLSAAVYLLNSYNSISFVSHITHNMVIKEAQQDLYSYLKKVNNKITRIAVTISGRNIQKHKFPKDTEREDTQRSRSFMFLCLAALFARREGNHKIIFIGENGQMAIHLPLTASRIGAFSTRTAHPKFIADITNFLQTIYSYSFVIENPFVYKTKAEVVSILVKKYEDLIPFSISCWRTSRVKGGMKHCGECIPCMVRRIALEHNNIKLNEYYRDIFNTNLEKLTADDIGKINLTDLLEFVSWFDGSFSDSEIIENFPGLYSQFFSTSDAVDMYKRFSKEAKNVFFNYPNILKYL